MFPYSLYSLAVEPVPRLLRNEPAQSTLSIAGTGVE